MEPPEGGGVDITASALPKGHYNPKNDVILHMECMTARDVRVSSPSCQQSLQIEHPLHVHVAGMWVCCETIRTVLSYKMLDRGSTLTLAPVQC